MRYYLLALASGVVKNVYWHQLIAPGYGLIDDRDNKFTKYPAYIAFKTLLAHLTGTDFLKLNEKNGCYCATFNKQSDTNKKIIIEVFWSTAGNHQMIDIDKELQQLLTRDGESLKVTNYKVNESPVYRITQDSST